MKRQKLRIVMVQQYGKAQRFVYDDGTNSDWVPVPGRDYPGAKFRRPVEKNDE